MSNTQNADTDAGGCAAALIGLVMLLALSLIPALVGPLTAPGLFAPARLLLCEDSDRDGGVTIHARRTRKGVSYTWDFSCIEPSGRVRTAASGPSLGLAWAVFNLGGLATLGLAIAGHRALVRATRRGLLGNEGAVRT